MNEKALKTIFLISLLAIGVLYGGAAVTFKFFPYEIFEEAKLAWTSTQTAKQDEKKFADKPVQAKFLEKTDITQTVVNHEGHGIIVGQEDILVSGGNYQMLSHCPVQGCLAWIVDRKGKVKHIWSLEEEIVERLRKHIADNSYGAYNVFGEFSIDKIYPMGVHLYENGDLLVNFQSHVLFPYAVGIAKFDKDSNLLWFKGNYSHHWASVDEQGLIYTPSLSVVDSPATFPGSKKEIACQMQKLYSDRVLVLDPDGNQIEEIPIMQTLVESGYLGLITEGDDECDPTHLNFVRPLGSKEAHEYPGLNAGDLMVSLRTLDSIAILDRKTKRVKWIMTGKTVYQHSPVFAGNNNLLVFDNNGEGEFSTPKAKELSKIRLIDLATHDVTTVFPRKDGPPLPFLFYTNGGGNLAIHPDNKRVLISSYTEGRILEVDLNSGAVLWEYINSQDMSDYYKKKEIDGTKVNPQNRRMRFEISSSKYVLNPQFQMNPVNSVNTEM